MEHYIKMFLSDGVYNGNKENPNKVFTKVQIYRQVWGQSIKDDNVVMVYMSHLREKIEVYIRIRNDIGDY